VAPLYPSTHLTASPDRSRSVTKSERSLTNLSLV
jgi:hypothetical protein